MAGLIPLMLTSGTRTSFIGASPPSSKRQSIAGRKGSTSSTSSISSVRSTSPARSTGSAGSARPAEPACSVDSTTQVQSTKVKLPKRMSLPTPAPLPVLPYTQADWKKTIAEVKRQYYGKRYRACSTRCLEVLEGVKNMPHVDPVYLIYLHFYAATSMEICARPLPSTSALRTTLLQQARTHFDLAGSLISAAEESVIKRVRPFSATSSRGSSCHSPSGSISSRSWTPDTRISSPTESVYSFDDPSAKSQSPPKRGKKVSFSLPREESLQIPEPVIRPDSPTLGFDDIYFQAGAARQELPEIPSSPPPPPKFQEVELPLHTMSEGGEAGYSYYDNDDDEDSEHAYLVARAVDRCCEHLAGLRAQLARHSASLSELLSAPPSSLAGSLAEAAKSAAAAAANGGRRRSTAEEARALDRQARIERGRKNGWQRKRFDARRYEELCETVLAELA